jgi:ATP adenylyltransferase/5',5'''-P-1,P-4-tetraphosphate phosphorylase II
MELTMTYAEQFANGYAHFALSFLITAVVGVVFFFIKLVKEEIQEENQKKQDKNTAIMMRLAKKFGHLTVEYNEKFNTYYVFNTETGAFVSQNQNPLELLEYVRDSFIVYELDAKDETTARVIVEQVKALQQKRSVGA